MFNFNLERKRGNESFKSSGGGGLVNRAAGGVGVVAVVVELFQGGGRDRGDRLLDD